MKQGGSTCCELKPRGQFVILILSVVNTCGWKSKKEVYKEIVALHALYCHSQAYISYQVFSSMTLATLRSRLLGHTLVFLQYRHVNSLLQNFQLNPKQLTRKSKTNISWTHQLHKDNHPINTKLSGRQNMRKKKPG